MGTTKFKVLIISVVPLTKIVENSIASIFIPFVSTYKDVQDGGTSLDASID